MYRFLWLFVPLNLFFFDILLMTDQRLALTWAVASAAAFCVILSLLARFTPMFGTATSARLIETILSVYSLPLHAVFFIFVAAILFKSLNFVFPERLASFPLGFYYIGPTAYGVLYLSLSIFFVILAACSPVRRLHPRRLIIHSLPPILFLGYVSWWHLTSQKWTFL